MLVSVDVWEKALDILLCGLDRNTKYKFMSKWNSYIGLAATDSIPVSMPNIVVIDDNYHKGVVVRPDYVYESVEFSLAEWNIEVIPNSSDDNFVEF